MYQFMVSSDNAFKCHQYRTLEIYAYGINVYKRRKYVLLYKDFKERICIHFHLY